MKCQHLLMLSFVYATINARPQNGDVSGDSVLEKTTQGIEDSDVTVAAVHDLTTKLTENLQKWNSTSSNSSEESPNQNSTTDAPDNEQGGELNDEAQIGEGLSRRNLLGVVSGGSGRGLLQGITYGLISRLLRLQILNFILGGGKLPSLSRGGLLDGILRGDLKRGLLGGVLKGVLGPGVLSGLLKGGLVRGLLDGVLRGILRSRAGDGLARPSGGLLGRQATQRSLTNLNLGGILNLRNTTSNTLPTENLLSNDLIASLLRIELMKILLGAAKLIKFLGNKSQSSSVVGSGIPLGNLKSESLLDGLKVGPLFGGLGGGGPLLDVLEGEKLLGDLGGKLQLENLGDLEKLLGDLKKPLGISDNPLGGVGGLLGGHVARKLSPDLPDVITSNIDDICRVLSLNILSDFLNEILKLKFVSAILSNRLLVKGSGGGLLGGLGSGLGGGLLGGLGDGLIGELLGGVGSGGLLGGLGNGLIGGLSGGLDSGISGGLLGEVGSGGLLGGLGNGLTGGLLGGLGSGITGGLLGGFGDGLIGGLLGEVGSGGLLGGLGNGLTGGLLGGLGNGLSGGLLGGAGSGGLLGGLGNGLTGGLLGGLGSGITGGLLGGLGNGLTGGLLGGLGSGITGGLLGGLGNGLSGGLLGGLGNRLSGGLLGGVGSGLSGGLLGGLGSGFTSGIPGLGPSVTSGLLGGVLGSGSSPTNSLVGGLIRGRSSITEHDAKSEVQFDDSQGRDDGISPRQRTFDENELFNRIFGKLRYIIQDSYRTLQFRRGFDLTHGISSGWSNFQKSGKIIISQDQFGRTIFGVDILFPKIEVRYRIHLLRGILGSLLSQLLKPIPPSENPLLSVSFRNVRIFIIVRPIKERVDLLDFIIKKMDAEPLVSISTIKPVIIPLWIKDLIIPLIETSLQNTVYDAILKSTRLALRNTKLTIGN